jgi:LPS-assembly protein
VIGETGRVLSKHLKRLTGGLAVSALVAGMAVPMPVFAQDTASVAGLTEVGNDVPLLLQANELIYDQNQQTVAAVGGVQIDYGGTRMVADRVVYNQRTSRMKAFGNVEIVQPDKTTVYADEIDVTDDFRDGFVNALRIVTPDRTHFAAESAIRENGETTTFNNGVYTACEPCKDRPEKPPVWQIKSQRIIWNGKKKTVRFERASFEFLGIPLAYLPVFTTADPTVKRKTGFLAPGFRFSDELGAGLSIPYFIALAPNYDLRLTGTGYTKQGFLGEAEFRHRLKNGTYTLKVAGIHQLTPDAFDANTVDRMAVNRGMVGTTGNFSINPRWTFGWNVLAQSDKNFSRTYRITGFDDLVQQNEFYLTGLGDRNVFDVRAMKFAVQESVLDRSAASRDNKQPWVLPSLDYDAYADNPVAGGELAFSVNARGISRDAVDTRGIDPLVNPVTGTANYATRGIDGRNARVTAETEWKRTMIMPGGLAVTPILAAQTDANFIDSSTGRNLSSTGAMLTTDHYFYRAMVTAGLELRWPILFSSTSSTHVLEPVAQVFVRPDETGAGILPNEDAQSFVFDTTNLFERDKFSGYDRIEGGRRANIGLRYTGTLNNGWTFYGLFGQSYHLGGTNPFASADMLNAGQDSGLETGTSDFVGMFGASFNSRWNGAVRARFDEQTFKVRRAETEVKYNTDRFAASGEYAFIQAQPTYGFATDRHEVTARASLLLREFWRVSGETTYDITNTRLARNSIALAYDDECFGVSLLYRQTRDYQDKLSQTVGLRITLRTLGDFGSDTSLDGFE